MLMIVNESLIVDFTLLTLYLIRFVFALFFTLVLFAGKTEEYGVHLLG